MFETLRVPGGALRVRVVALATASLLAMFLYLPVREAYADVAVGGSSAGFLGFEIGGRPAGMGGAQTASATGVTAQFWNPGGLTSLDRPQVGAMHATWLGDLSYEWLGYARPVGGNGAITSLSVAYFHMPSINGVDEFDNPTGEFKVYDMAVTAGYARPMGKGISLGVNGKVIRQTLATVSATGVAMDFGAMAETQGMKFGAVVQNLGPSLSFDGTGYPLPRQIRFGASRQFYSGRVLLAADYDMPSNYYNDIRVGTEFRAHPNVSLRLGYRKEFSPEPDPGTGISFGLGLSLKQLTVDYAMTPSSDFDNVQRLSFGYSFGSGPSDKEVTPAKPEETKPAPPPPAPTGPPMIAAAKPAPAPAKSPVKPVPSPAPAAAPPVVASTPPAPKAAPAPVATAPAAPTPAPSPSPAPSQYAVVLPGYQSQESAQAELKALELLGFRTKDATISKDLNRNGYVIVLSKMKSKNSAEDMVKDLSRMSFRANVEVVQR